MHFARAGAKPTSIFDPLLVFECVSTIGGKNLAAVSLVLKADCWCCGIASCSSPNLADFCVGTSPVPGLQENSTMGLCFCIALWVPGNVVSAEVFGSSQKSASQLHGKMRVVCLYVSPLCIFYRGVVVKRWRWKVAWEMRADKELKMLGMPCSMGAFM